LSGCASLGSDNDGPGEYDAAKAASQYNSVSSAPRAEDMGKEPSATDRLNEGDRNRDKGNLQEAVLAYLRAASLNPQDMTPTLRIAYLQLTGDATLAEKSFFDVTEKDPQLTEAWLGLGLAQLAQGKSAEARTSLERAVELSPDAVAIRTPLGAVYDQLGEHALAQEQFTLALAAKPHGISELNNLAVSLMMSGDHQGAEVYLRKALMVDDEDEATLNNLGLSLGFQGRTVEAIEVFTRAGDRQSAFNNLGYVYFLNGKNDEAVKAYERALLIGGEHDKTILKNLRDAQAAQLALQEIAQSSEVETVLIP
jgi:Flp pilus assembly protein TadD